MEGADVMRLDSVAQTPEMVGTFKWRLGVFAFWVTETLKTTREPYCDGWHSEIRGFHLAVASMPQFVTSSGAASL